MSGRLSGRRTARDDAAAGQDEPVAAPFLNPQDPPRAGDRISERDLLLAIATVNYRDAVPHILDAIVPEQGPLAVESGCFIRGGRFQRRSFRRDRREGIGRTWAREGGSLLQLAEPCRKTGNFRGRRGRDGDLLLQFVEPRDDIGGFRGRRGRQGGFCLQLVEPRRDVCKSRGGILVALAELVQTRSVLALDPVEPDAQLCERGAEVGCRGPRPLARALAGDRRQV